MSDNKSTPVQPATSGGAGTRTIRPRLTFYHANSKGSGSAVRFEMSPGNIKREGAVYMNIAQQKSVASGSGAQRQYATFDWQNSMLIKLNFTDICQILMVLKGVLPSAGDGKGLFHESRKYNTIIGCSRQAEPYAGVAFEVSRRSKENPEASVRMRILLNTAEAFGFGLALEQIMGQIAFGMPPASYTVATEAQEAAADSDDEALPF